MEVAVGVSVGGTDVFVGVGVSDGAAVFSGVLVEVGVAVVPPPPGVKVRVGVTVALPVGVGLSAPTLITTVSNAPKC